jgi:hypothetical protein
VQLGDPRRGKPQRFLSSQIGEQSICWFFRSNQTNPSSKEKDAMNKFFHFILSTLSMTALTALYAAEPSTAFLSPDAAGPDFAIQGEYTGDLAGAGKTGIQVIALGDGLFHATLRQGGLPGDGWNKQHGGDAEAKLENGKVTFALNNGDWPATLENNVITVKNKSGETLGALQKVLRKSPTLGESPAKGAVIIFGDNHSLDNVEGGSLDENGLLKAGFFSKPRFQNCFLHVEFMLPFMPWAREQGRANSGVYLGSRHEVQILDSMGLPEQPGHCGGIYSVGNADQDMCFPPLSWQTYDIVYTAARYDEAGQKTKDAMMTVWHNGVLIHKNVVVDHATTAAPWKEGPEDGPVYFQDHGNPVRYRNIWAVER